MPYNKAKGKEFVILKDMWRAIKYGAVNKKLTFIAIFTSFLFPIIDIFQPLIMKELFDLVDTSIRSGVTQEIINSFIFQMSIYSLLIIADIINSQVGSYYFTKWWNFTRQKLGTDVFEHLESLSLKYFETNTTGKIKERVDKGINDLNSILDITLMEAGPQILFILAAGSILLFTAPVFGAIVLLGIPFFVYISRKYFPIMAEYQDKRRDSDEAASGILTESIINIKTIKSYATEKRHKIKLFKQLDTSNEYAMKYQIKRIIMNSFRFTILNTVHILVLGLGLYWTITGKITLGTFTLAWQYTNRSLQPLWWLMKKIDDIQRDMRSVRRVFELIDTKPEILDEPNAKKLRVGDGDICFNNIGFSYKNRKILNQFKLEIPGSKVLAIVGKSGSGKSTLIKLLLRFYEPQIGNISINSQNINEVTQKSLRENVSFVSQDSILFNDTAANNIAYGKTNAKMSEIITAAKKANAHNFIMKLPNGYETVVGERGVRLSGGEQQRINIARAILKNAPILVLDEATSSLDSESEKLIQDAIWKLTKGKTTIIIAHRLSTVMRADLIVVMDKGKIVESGSHRDLVEEKGIYSKLFEIQSGGYIN